MAPATGDARTDGSSLLEEMVRRHILALRDAMALSLITKRTLVLPRLPCLCDRSEGPTVLRECKYETEDSSRLRWLAGPGTVTGDTPSTSGKLGHD